MPWQAMQDDIKIPNLRQGENLMIVSAQLTERRTTPPGYLTGRRFFDYDLFRGKTDLFQSSN